MKHSTHPHLFVDPGAGAWRRQSLEHQPKHTKQYKLHKIFGERVGVPHEASSLLEDDYENEGKFQQMKYCTQELTQ